TDNASPSPKTQLVVDEVIVGHDLVKGRRVIWLSRDYPPRQEKFLVLLDSDDKGGLDAAEGVVIDDQAEILKYLNGARKLKDKCALDRIRYNIDFLRRASTQVTVSAHIEVRRASGADLRKIGAELPAGPIVKALEETW